MTLASANQQTQNKVTATSEGVSWKHPVTMPQLQNNVTAAPPGTAKASSTPAVAGMGTQDEFPNRTVGTPKPRLENSAHVVLRFESTRAPI